MKVLRFYHQDTGIIHPVRKVLTDDAAVAANTPPDHLAIDDQREPPLDHLSQRVAVEQPKVSVKGGPFVHPIVDWQPPQPSDQHEWDGGTKRWRLTAAAQERERRRVLAKHQRAALIEQQHDLVRKAVLGDAAARTALAALDAELEQLRADL